MEWWSSIAIYRPKKLTNPIDDSKGRKVSKNTQWINPGITLCMCLALTTSMDELLESVQYLVSEHKG